MPSYVTPKKNTAYVFFISLPAQSQSNTFQSNPTLAAGDFKVSIDGGALANLTTLPTVTPASGKMVKISLSTSEMNGDNITVVCSDASGAEWKDVVINIQTSARQIDDLAYPTTSGRSLDVTATGEAGIDWANIGSPTTEQILSATTVGTATTIGTTGLAAIWDRLTSALSTSGSVGKLLVDNINATISSRASQTSLDDVPTNAELTTALGTADDATLAAIAALNNISVADVLAGSVEGSLDIQETLRLVLAVLVGKSSGGGTTNVVFRDTADSTDRVDATVDSNGNRSSVTLDPS